MRLIDLSQPLFDGCPNCPVHRPVSSTVVATNERDGWHMEELHLSLHTASHLDAPLHKIAGGKSIDQIPLDSFVGTAILCDLRDSEADRSIGAQLLASRIAGNVADGIVLLATGWGDRRAKSEEWQYHSPYLAPDGAQWLVDQRARAVGIDHYSIGGSRDPDNTRTHEILLGNGLWVVEDLHFPKEIFDCGPSFQFMALPINFPGHSGAFCRPAAVLS
ncbi:MAG: cyclase family protein [bacterium]